MLAVELTPLPTFINKTPIVIQISSLTRVTKPV